MGRMHSSSSRRSTAPPRHPRQAGNNSVSSSSSSSSDSESSSDDDSKAPQLDAARYEAAQLAAGLTHRAFRLAAVRELQAVLQQGLYASATKGVQAMVYADLLVAAQQHDSRLAVREATCALLAAARRAALPQQRRQALTAELKQAGVAASRAARKQGAAGCSVAGGASESGGAGSDDEDEAGVVLGDVPDEVVCCILSSLDPCSLAAAACVCRSWHTLATRDELWRHSLAAAFPKAARRSRAVPQPQPELQQPQPEPQQPQQQHEGGSLLCKQFAAEAARHPEALLPWRSCRALVCGKLQWRLPAGAVAAAGGSGGEAAAALAAARTAVQQQGAVPPGPLYLSTAQAIKWMLRRPMREVVRPAQHDSSGSSSDDEGDSDSSGSDGGCGSARLAARLRLWAAPIV